MATIPVSSSVKAYLQELQPVIELLNEDKKFGAQSLCDIIAARYPDEDGEELNQECRDLLSDVISYLTDESEDSPSLEDIRTSYQDLKERFL